MTKTELLSVIETNITNASLPSSITPSVMTSVLNALANYDPCPYKIYSALISQSDTNAPTVSHLFENTLGADSIFTYSDVGVYQVSVPNIGGWSNIDKISITIGPNFYVGSGVAIYYDSKGLNTTELAFNLRSKSNSSTLSNHLISGNLLEIRIPL
jgi:hypothetical protein